MTSLCHEGVFCVGKKKDKKGEGKKNTSLRLDEKTLKALKIHAIEHNTSVQKIVEKLIKEYLARK